MMRRRKECTDNKENLLLKEILEAQDEMKKELQKMQKEIHKMAKTVEEVLAIQNAVVAKVVEIKDALVDLAADVTEAFRALNEKIEAGGTTADLEPLAAAAQEALDHLTAVTDSLKVIDDSAESITGIKTPPVA